MPTRRRIEVTGQVQGVGFRPGVHRLARRLGLDGWVENRAGTVTIEVQGSDDDLDAFAVGLRDLGGRIDFVETTTVPAESTTGFVIHPSRPGTGIPAFVHDRGPCAACTAEIHDEGDRRGGYLLNTCTVCGPRHSILRRLPWDRATSTLDEHPPCAACRAEYDDPEDRRFHAEGIVCPDCGPTLAYRSPDGAHRAGGRGQDRDVIAAAAADLEAGGIVAVKGIGGYHLAVDATDDAAVLRLRGAKARDAKPFAVLVADLDAARALCHLDDAGAAALVGPARPIVLAPRRAATSIAASVAPDVGDLGLVLPPSLVHAALADAVGRPLVLTSGNDAGAPVLVEDAPALRRLGPSVAGLVVHDRAIARRADDAVVRQVRGGIQAVRIGRGDSPVVLRLPAPVPEPILAVGAHLKNTVAVAVGADVVVSPHLGDQDHPDSVAAFEEAVAQLCATVGVDPEVIACDAHPDAGPTQWAERSGRRLVPVQHHHAHLAAVLVEHRIADTGVVGVIADGFGLGADGTAWGGELLEDTGDAARRLGHLRRVPLPGGDRAARQPWRMAVAWAATVDESWATSLHPDAEAVLALCRASTTTTTTSVGRLFDAVAFLALGTTANRHDGQAAMALEAAALRSTGGPAADAPAIDVVDGVVDPRAFLAWLRTGPEADVAAASFHDRLAQAMVIWPDERAASVVLGGGVFQNRLLSDAVTAGLAERGHRVLTAGVIPPNDAGISVGQIRVASARLRA